jgi:hypothetical protein
MGWPNSARRRCTWPSPQVGHQRLSRLGVRFCPQRKIRRQQFFNNGRGIKRSIYKQTISARRRPVWIPKLYNGRNKTFFFWSYEGFRNRDGQRQCADRGLPLRCTTAISVTGSTQPASRFRSDPIDAVTAANGTVTRQVFSNNLVPKNLFDPQVVKALAAFRSGVTPLPNNGAAPTLAYVNNNYLITSGTEIRPNTKMSVKGDHVFSGKAGFGYSGYNWIQPEARRERTFGPARLLR